MKPARLHSIAAKSALCAIGLTSVFFAACAPITPVPPKTTATSSREDVHIEIIGNEDAVTVEVSGSTGIGSAEATFAAPIEALTLRLHLNGLEEFRFVYDDVETQISVSSADASVLESVRLNGGEEEPIEPDSPYWMDVRILDASGAPTTVIPLQDGVIEVSAPPDFIASERLAFTISWIDFYR